MAVRRRHLGRVGLLVLGAIGGFVVSLLLLYLFVQRARTRVVEERVRVALGLPAQAFTLENIERDFLPRFREFYGSEALRTCGACGHVMEADPRFVG